MIGTYTRTTALDRLINAFLSVQDKASSSSQTKQIISLGAGTDTRPFRLFSRQDRHHLVYHEVDFEVVSQKKLRTVQTNQALSEILGSISASEESNSWSSQPSRDGDEYRFHGIDLRRLAELGASEEKEEEEEEEAGAPQPVLAGLRTDMPTLVVSECCLCYLSPSQASGLLSYFTSRVADIATIIYEPIRPDDPFGKVMTSNLAARHIRMPTLSVYPEPSDQEKRLRKAGFDTVSHMTMGDIWKSWLSSEGRDRVDGLEGLDEIEEWELLAAHYIVVWGSRGGGFKAWERLDEADKRRDDQ